MELTQFVLVTSPFAAPGTMLDTAQALRDAGVTVTETGGADTGASTSLEDWALSLLPTIPRAPVPIVVGLGAGTVLAAWLAPRLDAAGLVLVDGAVPPDHGPCEIKDRASDTKGETLELQPWRHIPTGYLRLSPPFEAEARDAEALGWPVERINGAQTQAALLGTETAGALMAVVGAFE